MFKNLKPQKWGFSGKMLKKPKRVLEIKRGKKFFPLGAKNFGIFPFWFFSRKFSKKKCFGILRGFSKTKKLGQFLLKTKFLTPFWG